MAEQYGEVSELVMPDTFPVDEESYIRLYAIRPSGRHLCWTLFTVGMSAVPMVIPDRQEEYRFAELLIHLPASWRVETERGNQLAGFMVASDRLLPISGEHLAGRSIDDYFQ